VTAQIGQNSARSLSSDIYSDDKTYRKNDEKQKASIKAKNFLKFFKIIKPSKVLKRRHSIDVCSSDFSKADALFGDRSSSQIFSQTLRRAKPPPPEPLSQPAIPPPIPRRPSMELLQQFNEADNQNLLSKKSSIQRSYSTDHLIAFQKDQKKGVISNSSLSSSSSKNPDKEEEKKDSNEAKGFFEEPLNVARQKSLKRRPARKEVLYDRRKTSLSFQERLEEEQAKSKICSKKKKGSDFYQGPEVSNIALQMIQQLEIQDGSNQSRQEEDDDELASPEEIIKLLLDKQGFIELTKK